MRALLLKISLTIFVYSWIGEGALAAPPTAGTQKLPEITSTQIESKIKEIEATEDIDEDQKKKLIELYQKALSIRETAHGYDSAAQSFAHAIEANPQKSKEIRAKLEKTPKVDPSAESMGVSEDTPLTDLVQRLAKEQADLAAVSAKLDELERNLHNLRERPQAIRQRLTEANELQQQIADEFQSAPQLESQLLTEAQKLLLKVRQSAVSSEIQMLDQELLSQAPRLELYQAQRDETARSVSSSKARVNFLRAIVDERRIAEAKQAQADAAEAEKEAAGKSPLIRSIAKQNAKLGKQEAKLAADIETVGKQKEAVERQVKQIEKDFESARQKLQIAGLSKALGRALSDQRRRLPELRQFKKRASLREDLIAEIGLRQIQVAEELREFSELEQVLARLMEEAGVEGLPDDEPDSIRDEARALLQDRKKLLAQARDINSTYLRALGELDFSERRLLDTAQNYARFLKDHLLWIPSDQRVGFHTIIRLPAGVMWLTAPDNWWEVSQALLDDAVNYPLVPFTTLLLIAMLLRYRPRMKELINGTSNKVGKPTVDKFVYTFQALTATLLLALPWPLLMAVVAWRLTTLDTAINFAQLVGQGLSVTAPMLFNLLAFRALCRLGGVAEVHFGWPKAALGTLRHHLDILAVVSLPAAFIAVVAGRHPEQLYRGNLSIISYIVVMLGLAYFFQQILNPKRGITHSALRSNPQGWPARLRIIWYPLAIASPLSLAVLASLGYYYTAAELTLQLIDTLWLILGIVIVNALILRWLMITRRKLALQAARERREAARAARKAAPVEEETGMVPVEEEALDLAAIDAQTRKLLNVGAVLTTAVGAWLIWSDVLPALGVLDQVSVWQTTLTVEGETKVMPITLADLGLAAVIGVLTAVAGKNLPGVLELAILQRSGMETGSRYAIKTLTQYLIVTVGFILLFQTIGFSWSQIQWLVAALGVGLGFGLQEIFGNFISGLIILFERPIRVGDIVTVGDTTGTVTRIRIRATTITNWDRQELLVPNKEFITSRLLNWTLSDQTNRITITVGVAYGSDVKRALELMAEAAGENENVLHDPHPLITFEGFGDNALSLILRAYLSSLEHRLGTISALHEAINRKFNDAGIVIAFPQRDVHIDTTRPLDVRLHRSERDSWPQSKLQDKPS